MKDKYKITLIILILILLCILIIPRFFNGDIFYSIKVGEWIDKYGLDFKDHASWISNLTYTYPHWLFDFIVYKIYLLFSYDGIFIFYLFFYIILSVLIFTLNYKRKKSIISSFLTALIVTICISSFALPRAQIISYILFLIEIYLIESYLENKNKKSLIFLFIIPLILANIHIGIYYFYFVLFLPYICEYFIAVFKRKYNINSNFLNKNLILKENKNVLSLLYFIPFMFLMGLISPLGLNVFSYYPKALLGNSFNYIFEYSPITIDHFLSFFIFLIIYIFYLLCFNAKYKISNVFLVCGLVIMSFMQVRNYPLFLVCSSFIFCNIIENLIHILRSLKKYFCFSIIFLILILLNVIDLAYYRMSEKYCNDTVAPKNIVKYIKDNYNLSDIRLYNEYDIGSFLMFNDIPVMIDSRAELYTKEFNSKLDNFFDEYMNIELTYEFLFEKYKVTHAIVDNDSILFKELSDKGYNVLYHDKFYSLFEILVGEN